ncbi:uncharacterized protein LOC101846685 [Aplysia californica]|uniref:Uncharacterized protein LOC101846685 n=1 Tax=Aplysia californica TaxID=6500 RepID=A0ABM0K1U6_APLCA|nr:uncharacterized protein LOC101846685 [Aplysia californica]
MSNWRFFVVAVISMYFLTMSCHACKKKKKEFETKLCKYKTQVITGFPSKISEHSLKNPLCSSVFSSVFETESTVANWWLVLDKKERWAYCPQGHFLQGFKFTKREKGIYALEEGRCTKSNKLKNAWGHCYQEYTSRSTRCRDNYYLAGIYRGDCSSWSCVTKLKCCKMTTDFTVDSAETAKEKVMTRSLLAMAQLASYLGYARPHGCYGVQPGDNFEKKGNSWEAKKCSGRDDRRLKISYKDWTFSIANMKYSQTETTELVPKTIDNGVLVNNHPTPAVEIITRNDRSIRTVKHRLTSHWKVSVEVGVKVTYTPPSLTGGVGGEFSFSVNAEGGEETMDETGNTQEASLEIRREKELDPYTSMEWVARMYQSRTTQYYKATLRVECSAELDGDLKKDNYHTRYGGKNKNYFSYTFGDADTPFYEAVKEEKDQWSYPWRWGDLAGRESNLKNVVGYLADQKSYEFVIEGKFDDIQGYKVEMEFGNHTELPRPDQFSNDRLSLPLLSFRRPVGKGESKVVVANEGPDDPLSGFQPIFN